MKSLIVYFSRVGETFVDGQIKPVNKGFTEIVAEKIAAISGGDLFKLEPEEPFSEYYPQADKRAKEEYENNTLPPLKDLPQTIKDYDVIYIGFPIFYRSYPRVIAEFLRHFDFQGKVVKPFCTNEEGSFGTAELELRALLKGATLKPGFAIRGYLADKADDNGALSRWVNAN